MPCVTFNCKSTALVAILLFYCQKLAAFVPNFGGVSRTERTFFRYYESKDSPYLFQLYMSDPVPVPTPDPTVPDPPGPAPGPVQPIPDTPGLPPEPAWPTPVPMPDVPPVGPPVSVPTRGPPVMLS